MLGLVVICHGQLAEELVNATRNIIGDVGTLKRLANHPSGPSSKCGQPSSPDSHIRLMIATLYHIGSGISMRLSAGRQT